jgi:galactose mutarotase-like enzyme
MARHFDSKFQNILPMLKRENVGAINWGLVAGKTNTNYKWGEPIPDGSEPELWFHDILRKDGTSFDPVEIDSIKVINSKLQKVAIAFAKESGIKLEVFSDKSSLQIYNAWLFDGKDIGKSGKHYEFSGGFIMEAQGYPDAPNHENFPKITIRPGELYIHKDIYKFSITNN